VQLCYDTFPHLCTSQRVRISFSWNTLPFQPCQGASRPQTLPGDATREWCPLFFPPLVITRIKDGSWTLAEGDGSGKAGGRLMVTSFSLLILESSYRHYPLHLAEKSSCDPTGRRQRSIPPALALSSDVFTLNH
jgi:hypothetical protein